MTKTLREFVLEDLQLQRSHIARTMHGLRSKETIIEKELLELLSDEERETFHLCRDSPENDFKTLTRALEALPWVRDSVSYSRLPLVLRIYFLNVSGVNDYPPASEVAAWQPGDRVEYRLESGRLVRRAVVPAWARKRRGLPRLRRSHEPKG